MQRRIDLTGWEEIDKREVPQWVYNRAYKTTKKNWSLAGGTSILRVNITDITLSILVVRALLFIEK